jgi:ABC-type transporter Mla MlaB component
LASGESPTPPNEARRPLVLVMSGPVERGDVPGICARVRRVLADADPSSVLCDVGRFLRPDAVVVELLMGLQLVAGRFGYRIRLRGAGGELRDLLDLMGLSDVVQLEADLVLEPQRQAEQREQARGVQEEADSGDPTV